MHVEALADVPKVRVCSDIVKGYYILGGQCSRILDFIFPR